MSIRRRLLVAAVAVMAVIVPLAANAKPPAAAAGNPELLATLAGGAGSGSAIGPSGALYVPQPATGEIWRVDPKSGTKTLYASGLPRRFEQLPFGGVMDVAFYGSTAYALVSVVAPSFPAACSPPPATPTSSGSTGSTGPPVRPWLRTSARLRATTRPGSRSTFRQECSTRWSRSEADSSSPTAITIACTASPSTEPSRR